MRGRGGIISGIITLVIGSTVYSISQTDVINNFAKDTGLSTEKAEQYVESIGDDEMVPYDELGDDFIADGQYILNAAAEIDCINYEYEWETVSLSCTSGKNQMINLGNSEINLGKAYKKLSSETASEVDISNTIRAINQVNTGLNSAIVRAILDYNTVDELKKTNSYNKALLQAALDSN